MNNKSQVSIALMGCKMRMLLESSHLKLAECDNNYALMWQLGAFCYFRINNSQFQIIKTLVKRLRKAYNPAAISNPKLILLCETMKLIF